MQYSFLKLKSNKTKKIKFENTYHKYYNSLLNTATMLIGNYDDANDICQEVFISFYEKMDTIEKTGKWLFGTLRYKLCNFYRCKKVVTVDIDAVSEVKMPISSDNLDLKLLVYDLFIDNGIDEETLDIKLLNLIVFHSYSYEKAAVSLGISRDQVRYKYTKIIRKLRNSLNKMGIKNIDEC